MGNWDSFKSGLSNFIFGDAITPTTGAAGRPADFFINGGEVVWLRAESSEDLREIFEKCSPIASIISRMANAFANGNIEVVNRATQNYTRGQYKVWDKLIDNPNFSQTRSEFLQQLYLYTILRGWCYGLPIYPEGYTDVPMAIWLLPPWLCSVDPINFQNTLYTNQAPERTIRFSVNGSQRVFKDSELILFKDSSGLIDERTMLPKSRLLSLRMQITNFIGALESRGVLINRRGAIGILSNAAEDAGGVIPLQESQKAELQSDFRRYGLSQDQWQVIITNASLKWQSMVLPTKDLMLMEEHISDIQDMCDRLNYPVELLNMTKGVTYANKEEAKKLLYQDAIIPQAQTLTEQLNKGLKTADQNIEILNSYDHIAVLQDSVLQTATGRKANNEALLIEYEAGTITMDDWREENDLDRMNKPPFTLYKWELQKWLSENGLSAAPIISPMPNAEVVNIQNEENGSTGKVGSAA